MADEIRVQEPIGFNPTEKKHIKEAVDLVNETALKGTKKANFSNFTRNAALEKANFVKKLHKK